MIYSNVHRNKLHQELVDAGIDVSNMVVSSIDNTAIGAEIEFSANVDIDLVQSIIDVHDPTPSPPPLSETEKIRLEMARSNAELFEMMVAMMGGGM